MPSTSTKTKSNTKPKSKTTSKSKTKPPKTSLLPLMLEHLIQLTTDDVEFDTIFNAKTGYWDSVMTLDGYIISERSGEDHSKWRCTHAQAEFSQLFEGYDELDANEQTLFADELVTRTQQLNFENIGHITNNTIGTTNKTPIEDQSDPAIHALAEQAEALAEKPNFEDKMITFHATLGNDPVPRTYGVKYFKAGNLSLLTLYRKVRDPRPNMTSRWERHNLGNTNSSTIGVKGDQGTWLFCKETIRYWLDAASVDKHGNALTWSQICKNHPKHLVLQLSSFAQDYSTF